MPRGFPVNGKIVAEDDEMESECSREYRELFAELMVARPESPAGCSRG